MVPDAVDRISPTIAPDQPVLMHQTWRHLLFLHWKISPQLIQPLLPPGLTVDLIDGNAWVSVTPFTLSLRPSVGPAIPLLNRFHEVNVRTYVHRNGKDPGVWFFSLDASNPAAVAGARAAYKLPYKFALMTMDVSKGMPTRISYKSRRQFPGPTPANLALEYTIDEGVPVISRLGTLEHFLVERYILYVRTKDRLYRARVHHRPYGIQPATVHHLDETLTWAAKVNRGEGHPMVQYSPGVNVKIYPLERLRD